MREKSRTCCVICLSLPEEAAEAEFVAAAGAELLPVESTEGAAKMMSFEV